jgi:hypothetical protein
MKWDRKWDRETIGDSLRRLYGTIEIRFRMEAKDL